MAADVATTLNAWSTTAASNSPSGATAISTNLDDNLREMQAVVRQLAASNTLAAATTTDLSTVDATFVTLTGTATTITGLGTLTAGMYKWVVMNAAHTLTHNGTSLILPTAANITTASGDVALFLSLGSGNWRCMAYTRADGKQLLNTAALLSEIGAAAAANTIANGDYAQSWQWKLTTASKQALSLSESSASTGNDAILFDVGTVALSKAWPIRVRARTEEVFSVEEDGATHIASAMGQNLWLGVTSNGSTPSGTTAPGGVIIRAQQSTDATDGGDVNIIGGGNSGGGVGGNVAIAGGTGTTSGDVILSGTNVHVYGDFTVLNGKLKTFASTAPTITADGGTGAAIAGSDTCFQVTFGSGSPTSVTVTFNEAYTTAPYVLVSGTQSGQVVHVASVSTTAVQLSSSTAFSSGTKINVLCIEQGA